MFFIISQIMGGIALILVFISYFLRNKVTFLAFQIVANFFYALSFVFTNALVAGINSLISIIRCIVFYLYNRKNQDIPWFYLILFSVLYVSTGVIFFKSYFDIIVILTPILFTFAMMMKNMEKVRYLMILPNILLTFYGILCEVYTTAALDFMEVITIIVAIIKFYIKDKNKKFDSVYSDIDEENYKKVKKIIQDKRF